MQRRKVTRIKRKTKCNLAPAEWSKDTIFRGQDRNQGQEKIPRPRTEFSRTSVLEGELKPERSRRQILQIFWLECSIFSKI